MQSEDLNLGIKADDRTPPETHRELQKESGVGVGVEEENTYNLSKASHPIACIFTFLFKALAIFVYLLLGNFISNVATFIIVVVLGALDFWTVKNVTGRLLVGLRWWSDFDQQGKQTWRFQSPNKAFRSNRVDAAFFWTSQWAATGTWAAFLVMKALSLSLFWGLLTTINLALATTNLYGYFKCQRDHGNKIASFKGQIATGVIGTFFK